MIVKNHDVSNGEQCPMTRDTQSSRIEIVKWLVAKIGFPVCLLSSARNKRSFYEQKSVGAPGSSQWLRFI